MIGKRNYREIRKRNLHLLQSLNEKESKDTKNRSTIGILLPLSLLLFVLALIMVVYMKSDPVLLYRLTYFDKDETIAEADERLQTKTNAQNAASASASSLSTDQTQLPLAKQNSHGIYVSQDTTEFMWQKSNQHVQKGIVFLAHGCKHSPTEWFTSCKSCPTATEKPPITVESSKIAAAARSMPMESSLVQYILSRGYTVVAMKPLHNANKSQCWHPNDKAHVSVALRYVYNELGPENSEISVHAIGVANGGIFLGNHAETLILTHNLKFRSLVLMSCGIWHNNYKTNKYPAVLFVDSSRNSELCEHNNATIGKLHTKGISAIQLVAEPVPITVDFFYYGLNKLPAGNHSVNTNKHYTVVDASTGTIQSAAEEALTTVSDELSGSSGGGTYISREESRAMYGSMVKHDYLWPATGVLLKDPSVDRFQVELRVMFAKAVPNIVPSRDNMEWGHSGIVQLLKVAWGYKQEVSDEYMKEVVDWFDLHGR